MVRVLEQAVMSLLRVKSGLRTVAAFPIFPTTIDQAAFVLWFCAERRQIVCGSGQGRAKPDIITLSATDLQA
jgi:hypothetical protein